MNRLVSSLLLLAFACLPLGCDKSGTNKGPALAKVSGKVTLDGKPMNGGEVRFYLENQPAKSLEIKDGAFSGEVYVGKNRVDVVWDKDGPPNPMMPDGPPVKVNAVAPQFSGVNSPFNVDVPAAGVQDLKFEVTSARH
jgi:hypothetical protein